MKTPKRSKKTISQVVKAAKETVKPVVPQKTPAPVTPGDNTDVMEQLTKILSAVAADKPVSAPAPRRVISQEDIERIKSVLSEYMNSYIIIGYSAENSRVVLKHTPTHQDEDSLIEFLRIVLMNLMGGPQA